MENSSNTWRKAILREHDGRLVSKNDPDENALLRARTILAYLSSKNKLAYDKHSIDGIAIENEYIIVRNLQQSYNLQELLPEVHDIFNDAENEDVEVVVLYRAYEPISMQPALAFIRPTLSATYLFNKVWLKSSVSWLKKNPQERVDLDITFP